MLSLIRIVILINSPVSTFYSPFVLFIFSHVLIVTSIGKAGGRECKYIIHPQVNTKFNLPISK